MLLYEQGLSPSPVNHLALTPLGFIERSARIYPQHRAVLYGSLCRTWQQTYQRCRQLASALHGRGIGVGQTVAVMLPNIPAMLEVHFGVPMAGAVLNALNVRLDAESIAFMLHHAEAQVLIADREFHQVIGEALALLPQPPLLIEVDDPEYGEGQSLGGLDYEALLAEGDPDFDWPWPEDEWQAIALNYTSGTTGNPKGVLYHHRGAYLNALGNQMTWNMGPHPVYLWTLPMFHCNGWCYPWTVTALAGTHVFLRRVDPRQVLYLLHERHITHLCCAPIMLRALVSMPEAARIALEHEVQVMVAGAAPSAALIQAVEEMGLRLTQVYGLTEVYGPVVLCAPQPDWDRLPIETRARLKARQGVRYPTLEHIQVVDPETRQPVPMDGQTCGEILMRGNTLMKGYLKNPAATAEAFEGGWFHTGDLAVCHPDGYIEIRDRLKDIVISGGENISTLEVEDCLQRHPAVLEAAVVARPDERWGETPCAFVTLRQGQEVSESALLAFCRAHLAPFKVPKTLVFARLPKTATGKVQKYRLREWAKAL